jgi:hypothetical protein
MRWLRSPALHMLALGALVFGAVSLASGTLLHRRPRLEIAASRIEQMARDFVDANGRRPGADEWQQIPLALFSFNVGIELGQLAFISCVVAAGAGLRRLSIAWPRRATAAPAYAIGSLAIYWMIERIAGL